MKIGFRIEFFRNLLPDQSAAGLVAAASIFDAFEVDVVPAIHERVAGLSLLEGHGHLLEAHDSPFLRVRRVEHFPVGPSAAIGKAPRVVVILRALEVTGEDWERLQTAFRNGGWTLDYFSPPS